MSANTPEPAPIANDRHGVWFLVIADVERKKTIGGHCVGPHLVADMLERDRSGRAKYGTPLQAHNGRNPLVDAYQEVLDACVYLRQAIEEGQPVHAAYTRMLHTALDLRCLLPIAV